MTLTLRSTRKYFLHTITAHDTHRPMTAQEIFDTVVAHLRKQGCRSAENGTCLYRGPDGTKCAAGCLIPVEMYTPNIEGAWWKSGALDAIRKHVGEEHSSLIVDLQDTHDGFPLDQWEYQFSVIARTYHLTYTPQ